MFIHDFIYGQKNFSYLKFENWPFTEPNRQIGYSKNCSTIQYNTIRVYCENTLSYNNGVLSHTEPKSGSVKARQLIYRYSTNTIKLRVKKLDMDIYDILKGNVIVRRHCVVQKMGAGRAGVLLCPVTWRNSQKLVLCLASVHR